MITPNQITSLRFMLTFVLCGLLLTANSPGGKWACLILFLIASFTDFLDGFLARKKSLVSSVGKIIDPIADKFLTLGVFFVFAQKGLFSFWWVIPIAIREIWVTGIRLVFLRRGVVIGAESLGKIKTVSQMLTLLVAFGVLLLPENAGSLMHNILSSVLFFCLVLSNVLTLLSGIQFFRKLPRD